MRDRWICVNCENPRHRHYHDDGSWNEDLGCLEYEGRTPTAKEIKLYTGTDPAGPLGDAAHG